MTFLQNLSTVITKPQLLKKHKPLFLLSHMRANTSVLGHVLGSNPAVAGYYEMHIGYYNWKSLLRQKLLYYQAHDYKPHTNYIFDKVLHNYHAIETDLLNSQNVKVMICIREPEQTIKSIVNLFRENHQVHEYHAVDEAANYYCERLLYLMKLGPSLNEYFFFDASEIKTDTTQLFKAMSDWLELETPLQRKFKSFPQTGKKDAGDLSDHLKEGKLNNSVSDYSKINVGKALLSRPQALYLEASELLMSSSINSNHKV